MNISSYNFPISLSVLSMLKCLSPFSSDDELVKPNYLNFFSLTFLLTVRIASLTVKYLLVCPWLESLCALYPCPCVSPGGGAQGPSGACSYHLCEAFLLGMGSFTSPERWSQSLNVAYPDTANVSLVCTLNSHVVVHWFLCECVNIHILEGLYMKNSLSSIHFF